MKLKDFLKQFENEDPETEIVIPGSHDRDCVTSKIFRVKEFFCNFENHGICHGQNYRMNDSNIRMLKLG